MCVFLHTHFYLLNLLGYSYSLAHNIPFEALHRYKFKYLIETEEQCEANNDDDDDDDDAEE